MTRTVTIRCENEDCWKWFEPEVLDPALGPTDGVDRTIRYRTLTDGEAVCPHCGTRQAVPILDY